MRNNKLRRLYEWQNDLHHAAAEVAAVRLSGSKTIEELDARTAPDSELHRDLVACVKRSVPGSNFGAFVQSYGVSERARAAPAEKVAQHIGTQLLTQLRNGIESNGNTIVGFMARKAGNNSIGGGLLQKFRATTAPTSSANFKDDKTMYLRIATQALGQAGHTNRVVHSVYRPKVDEPVGHHLAVKKKEKHRNHHHHHIKTACPLTVSRIVHGRYYDGQVPTAAEMQVPVEEAEHMARRYHLFSGRVVQMDRNTPATIGQEVKKKKAPQQGVAADVQLASAPAAVTRRSDLYQVRAPVFMPLLGAPIPNDGVRLSKPMPPLGAPIFAGKKTPTSTTRVQSMMEILESGDLTI
jgi:hypothetical protein